MHQGTQSTVKDNHGIGENMYKSHVSYEVNIHNIYFETPTNQQ